MTVLPRNEDISVVVQGPVMGADADDPDKRWTKRTLESVRTVLPGAELILSTWEGSDLSDLDADVILENKDPGAAAYAEGVGVNNVNRQIASTRAGLEAARRPFALKMRSEAVLLHDGFRRQFGRYTKDSPAKVVRERVVALTQPSPVPKEPHTTCYSPSDWFHFGLHEDVLDIWNIPLAPEPDTSRWFETQPYPKEIGHSDMKVRYSIEQYIWVTFLRKHHEVDFDSMWDVRDATVAASEASIGGNLVLLSPREAGIKSLKYPAWTDAGLLAHIRRGYYTHQHWRVLYRRYSDGGQRALEPYLLLFKSLRGAGAGYRSLKARLR